MERDNSLLLDILNSARMVASHLEGHTRASFVDDVKTCDAVERRILIMGEGAAIISTEFKEAHPDIPWQRLVTLRNFYVHGYAKLEAEEVWATANGTVRRVESLVAALLPQPPGS